MSRAEQALRLLRQIYQINSETGSMAGTKTIISRPVWTELTEGTQLNKYEDGVPRDGITFEGRPLEIVETDEVSVKMCRINADE